MDKTLAKELELVEAVKAHLEDGKMARSLRCRMTRTHRSGSRDTIF